MGETEREGRYIGAGGDIKGKQSEGETGRDTYRKRREQPHLGSGLRERWPTSRRRGGEIPRASDTCFR